MQMPVDSDHTAPELCAKVRRQGGVAPEALRVQTWEPLAFCPGQCDAGAWLAADVSHFVKGEVLL